MMSKQKGEKTENSHRVQGTIPNAVRRWLKTSNAKISSNLTSVLFFLQKALVLMSSLNQRAPEQFSCLCLALPSYSRKCWLLNKGDGGVCLPASVGTPPSHRLVKQRSGLREASFEAGNVHFRVGPLNLRRPLKKPASEASRRSVELVFDIV